MKQIVDIHEDGGVVAYENGRLYVGVPHEYGFDQMEHSVEEDDDTIVRTASYAGIIHSQGVSAKNYLDADGEALLAQWVVDNPEGDAAGARQSLIDARLTMLRDTSPNPKVFAMALDADGNVVEVERTFTGYEWMEL